MYIQKNSEFSGIQELTFDEVDLVIGGGDKKKKEAPKKDAPKISTGKKVANAFESGVKKLRGPARAVGEIALAVGAEKAIESAVDFFSDDPQQ